MSTSTNTSDLPTDAYDAPKPDAAGKPNTQTNKKKLLAISTATLLMGGAAWAIATDRTDSPDTRPGETDPSNPGEPPVIPVDIDVAGKVTDDMSFEQAFDAARQEVGMAGVFSWHGHWYNTFNKEEWNSLSLEQRKEFTERIIQEELPVKAYKAASVPSVETSSTDKTVDPTIIEGYINGQRVMGIDFDQDGVVDTLVMEGGDGYTYRVVDTTGNEGLDTLYRFDSLDGELVEVQKIEAPFVLTNDQFSDGLEASMSKDVVESILEPEVVSPGTAVEDTPHHEVDEDEDTYLADTHEPDDDTYVNNGDVRDMDE